MVDPSNAVVIRDHTNQSSNLLYPVPSGGDNAIYGRLSGLRSSSDGPDITSPRAHPARYARGIVRCWAVMFPG